jgi:hypothetical protein
MSPEPCRALMDGVLPSFPNDCRFILRACVPVGGHSYYGGVVVSRTMQVVMRTKGLRYGARADDMCSVADFVSQKTVEALSENNAILDMKD